MFIYVLLETANLQKEFSFTNKIWNNYRKNCTKKCFLCKN